MDKLGHLPPVLILRQIIPNALLADSLGGFPNRGGADSNWRGGPRHGFSGEIARGLFGCRASGVGPTVEERQPEPAASVAGCGPGWHGPRLGGEGSAEWTARRCATGSIASTGRVWRASSTTGRRGPSLVFRRSNWLSSRRSSRPARIARRTGSSCWRRIDLKRVIAARLGVAFHERYVGKLLKKLGFSPMSARPRHAQNERAIEAFKPYGPPRLREIIRE